MGRKIHKPEEIVAKLRQVDVLMSQGQSIADAIQSIGITVCRARVRASGLRREPICATQTKNLSSPRYQWGRTLGYHGAAKGLLKCFD